MVARLTYAYDNVQETIAPACKHKVLRFSIKSAQLQKRKTFDAHETFERATGVYW